MDEMLLYKQVRPKRVADQVFEQIRDLIFRGQLKPGDQLPPERELAETMGVSRPTVRQAVGKLVNLGLVMQRQGQGTFVNSQIMDETHNPLRMLMDGGNISLRDLLEVRLGLECNSAVLAARRATEDDIQLMETSLEAMNQQIAKGGLGHEEDLYFHMRIAYASHNQLQVQLMKHVYDLLAINIRDNLHFLYRDPQNKGMVHDAHDSILDAIKQRNADEAFNAMAQHINTVIARFEAASRT
jgi:GntR family transcriptional repressor for pyruvate dehydrogenase complex